MQILNKKATVYLLHTVGSLLFISIPVFSSPDFNSPHHLIDVVPFQLNFIKHILLLGFFYANYLCFIPRLYFAKKQLLYLACIAACYIIIDFLPLVVIHGGIKPPPLLPGGVHPPAILPMIANGPLFSFLLVCLLGFFLKANQRMEYMKAEKLKTEVAYLKAQINPHFLFNTLNSIYALTLEKSDFAPEAIVKLSSMMRYVVSESSRESVSLEKEIDYIKNYISLQQLRMDGDAALSFIITGNAPGKSISPLLIIPFIENAFKYGLNPEEKSFITINIDITNDEFKLNIENSIVSMDFPQEEKTGQGLENTRQRLAYLYPDKHKLHIFDTGHTFIVNLSILLS